jgi:seryl-tRNA synthetase
MLQDLGAPYRVLDLCTGDLGNRRPAPSTSRSTRPGSTSGSRVSSVSWFRDYQARRANVRYRPGRRRAAAAGAHGQRLGPGLAADLGRPGGERAPADGTVVLPECLAPTSAANC